MMGALVASGSRATTSAHGRAASGNAGGPAAAGDGAAYIGGAFLDDDAFMYIGMNTYPQKWGLDEYTHGNPQMSFDGEIDDLAIYAGKTLHACTSML